MTITEDYENRAELIEAIASREGTAGEIAKWYGFTVSELQEFVRENVDEIRDRSVEIRREEERRNDPPDIVTPTQLDELWITNKFQRLLRYQKAADLLFKDIEKGHLGGAELATSLREFRSYLTVVANELGQLLNRGAGDNADGEVLNVQIEGIDLEQLK